MSPSCTSSASPRSGRSVSGLPDASPPSTAVSVTGLSVTKFSRVVPLVEAERPRSAPLLLLPGLGGRALPLRPPVAAAGGPGSGARLAARRRCLAAFRGRVGRGGGPVRRRSRLPTGCRRGSGRRLGTWRRFSGRPVGLAVDGPLHRAVGLAVGGRQRPLRLPHRLLSRLGCQ